VRSSLVALAVLAPLGCAAAEAPARPSAVIAVASSGAPPAPAAPSAPAWCADPASVADLSVFDAEARAPLVAAAGGSRCDQVTSVRALKLSVLGSLRGFEHLPHLARLVAADVRDGDLGPLQELPLEELSIGPDTDPGYTSTSIASLAPLRRLPLRSLRVMSGLVVDLAPLGDMDTLETLVLDRNAIADVSPLAQLSNLKNVRLAHNPITELPARGFVSLSWIDLSFTLVADATPLLDWRGLGSVFLCGSPAIEDAAARKKNEPAFERLRRRKVAFSTFVGCHTG
jgi:hypothetical protein